ncbi:MAG: geranylgeranylglyceryl/heptaprenylglyceryl phosphate synthase [FCB group bacterium]|nr:geranylgeranylglyceryl/heptaprenylglyceryl phosphate synthase [FCB group bacterium]
MTTFERLEAVRTARGACALALIDPDTKNDTRLRGMVNRVTDADFDGILVGGSLIMDERFEERLELIKSLTELPLVIFPGSSRQLSRVADAVLFLSLLSGRNPQYLIGEQVQSAPLIHSLGLETIPTGYILLNGGAVSSVQVMSNTNPLPPEKQDIILAHALAGQYLGMKLIFLESGSGAENNAGAQLVEHIAGILEIPLVVGGGIRSGETAGRLVRAGAGYVVIGNALEGPASSDQIAALARAVHHAENP